MDAYESADLDFSYSMMKMKMGSSLLRRGSGSWSGSSSESIKLNDVENGLYAVAVHGYSVSGEVQFWIDIGMIGGDKLNITDQIELIDSEIPIWPNGSETLQEITQ